MMPTSHLRFAIESPTNEGAPDRAAVERSVLVVENGVRFQLTGAEPPFVSVRSAFDRDGRPVVELLGRHDPRDQWTVLRQIARPVPPPAAAGC